MCCTCTLYWTTIDSQVDEKNTDVATWQQCAALSDVVERAILKDVFLLLLSFFGFLLRFLTSLLTELDPHLLRKKSNTPWGEEQECKSEQKLIPVHRKTSIHKAHTQDNVSGKFLQRLKTNVVTHQTHMSHKPLLNKVSCVFSYSEPFFSLKSLHLKIIIKKWKKKVVVFSFQLSEWVTQMVIHFLSPALSERVTQDHTRRQ